jgi:hypothetical protein
MPTRQGTANTINNMSSTMSPEELLDAINIQLQLQDNEQKAERILLRQELTESNTLVNRLVQTIDR